MDAKKHTYSLKIKKATLLGIAAAKGKGNTVKQVADNTNMRYQTILEAFSGRRYPSPTTLITILLATGLTLDEIMKLQLGDIFTLLVDGEPQQPQPQTLAELLS